MNKHFEIYRFDENDDNGPELYFTTEKCVNAYFEIRKPKGEDYRGIEYFGKNKYYSWSIYENELNRQGIESRINRVYNCIFSSGHFSSDYIEQMGGNEAIYNMLSDESELYKKDLNVKKRKY